MKMINLSVMNSGRKFKSLLYVDESQSTQFRLRFKHTHSIFKLQLPVQLIKD